MPGKAVFVTANRSIWTQICEETLACRIDQVEHPLEAVGTAVVRIRHLARAGVGRERHQQRDLGARARGADALQVHEVVLIHREDVVEAVEVRALHLAAAQVLHPQPALLAVRDGAAVGRGIDVVVGGAGGVDLDAVVEPRRVHLVAQHGLGGGGTADVAEADHQDANLVREELRHRFILPQGARRMAQQRARG